MWFSSTDHCLLSDALPLNRWRFVVGALYYSSGGGLTRLTAYDERGIRVGTATYTSTGTFTGSNVGIGEFHLL